MIYVEVVIYMSLLLTITMVEEVKHKASTLWANLPTALKEYSSINKFSKNLKVILQSETIF